MATWLKRFRIYLPRRGATAYEAQFGGLVIRYCHLNGGHWKHPLQPSRLSFEWFRRDADGTEEFRWHYSLDEIITASARTVYRFLNRRI